MKSTRFISKTISTLMVAGFTAAILLGPVLAVAKDKKKTPPIDISTLAWPSPPNQARVRYVGQYRGEDIAGLKKSSWLDRVAGIPTEQSRTKLVKPYGVAVDSKGRAYVADTAQRIVFVFDLEKKTLDFRGDKAPSGLLTPLGVAIDDKDRLFVSDAGQHNIACFAPNGSVVGVFGADDLIRPAGLAVDNTLRRLYVADVKARNVTVFDLDTFKKIRTFTKAAEGRDGGVFVAPTNIAIDPDGLVYVVDTFNTQIGVFDTDGDLVRTFGVIGHGPGAFARPKGIAFDSDGNVYVVDAMANQFQILTGDGKPLMPIGSMGPNPGQFNTPAGIAIDKYNRIFVVDSINRRLVVFRYISEAELGTGKGNQTHAQEQAPVGNSARK